ncbi:MAG: hypothetical protein HUU49_04475 [Candidatus Buchananbacteria bacterium]|nr:hypothetical protein [Candidatus Buchananbacteria bacterium]
MISWLMVSLIFVVVYNMFISFEYTMIYFIVVIGIFGPLLYIFKSLLTDRLQNWPAAAVIKFLTLGYGAVLTEEIFAALVNHLSEGFNTVLYLQRILQFWAFNIFAFSGLIMGWYVLTKKIQYSKTEIFFLTGVFGLWTERIFPVALTNPIAFFFWTPLVIFVYGIIITPAMLSINTKGEIISFHPILKYALTYAIIILFSLPPVIVLWLLRLYYPWLFPPAEFIPL